MSINSNELNGSAAVDPVWLKALAQSLARDRGVNPSLSLTVVVQEILDWVDLASGVDAWSKPANRESLKQDLDQSVACSGPAVRAVVATPPREFRSAFDRLAQSGRRVTVQPPGTRTDTVWRDLATSARSLLGTLDSGAAAQAAWDDPVAAAKDRGPHGLEYRPIADLLFDQLRRRGLHEEWAFRDLRSLITHGRILGDIPMGEAITSVEQRVALARDRVGAPADIMPIVVWLGYQGRAFPELSVGRVTFMDAHWHVPNASPERQPFDHKAELWELVRGGYLFRMAERIDEESEVDCLVRVDLGETTSATAATRAIAIVETILDVSIHSGGGIRPRLVQYALLCAGEPGSANMMTAPRESGFPDDHYGARATAEAVEKYGQRIAAALALDELPQFLVAALEVQRVAERPFSRDMALQSPSQADKRAVVPLADRVVQHVAAYAALGPNHVFDLMAQRWPHARWLTDVRRAAQFCLNGAGPQDELRSDLSRGLRSNDPSLPWILFVADRADDLLSVSQSESDRAWIARMFASVSDIREYRELVDAYAEEGAVLEARRGRVRNALVHGNPVAFAVVDSVRDYAEFVSSTALWLGLESYIDTKSPAVALATRTEEYAAMQTGISAAIYWGGVVTARTLPSRAATLASP